MRKSLVSNIVIFVIGALLLTGVNAFTAPIIEKNNSSKANGILLTVMPDAKGFETLYDINDVSTTTLKDVPETVVGVYKETSGLGYVLNLSTTKGFTKLPITITVGIDDQGNICGINLTDYPETVDFGVGTYEKTYVGQNSTLADVQLVTGATYASSAFKGAIEDGFAVLAANDLMKAAEKSATQILTEALSTIFSGICSPMGVPQYKEISTDADASWIANNGSGAVYFTNDLAVLVNASGYGKVYGVENGEIVDVTDAHADLVSKYAATTASNIKSTADKDLSKVTTFAGVSGSIIESKAFGSVVTAVQLEDGNYGFVCRTIGFDGENMVTTFIINANGEIVKMKVDTLFIEAEYFSNKPNVSESTYFGGFAGVTSDTFAGQEIITGATVTSDAVHQATVDAFATFNAITGGNN